MCKLAAGDGEEQTDVKLMGVSCSMLSEVCAARAGKELVGFLKVWFSQCKEERRV